MTRVITIALLCIAACGVGQPQSRIEQATTTTCGIPPIKCYPNGSIFVDLPNGGYTNPDQWCSQACNGNDINTAHCPEYTGDDRVYCYYHPGEVRNGQYYCFNIYPVFPKNCLSGEDPFTGDGQ